MSVKGVIRHEMTFSDTSTFKIGPVPLRVIVETGGSIGALTIIQSIPVEFASEEDFERFANTLDGLSWKLIRVEPEEMVQCPNCFTKFSKQTAMQSKDESHMRDVQFCPACGISLYGAPSGFRAIRQTNRDVRGWRR